MFTMMWSPGPAAILTQLIATRSLRGLGWRLGPARWLGIAYILPLIYASPVYAFTWLKAQGGAVFGVSGGAGVVLIIALSFMAAWLLSMVTYHGLEKPCLKLKARLSTFTDARTAPSVVLER